MSLLTGDELKALLHATDYPCISVYLPVDRADVGNQKNPTRLNNLLRQAETELTSTGGDKGGAQKILEPARRLVDDSDFWKHKQDGLAIFLAPGLFRDYRLPLPFEELVLIGRRLHIKPLLPLLNVDGSFYILAISQKRVRFYEATQHTCQPIELNGVPTSLEDALGTDWQEQGLQFHSGPSRGGGRHGEMIPGQGAGADDPKNEIMRFLRIVDEGILKRLKDRQAPLVVAAVNYLIPIYRKVSHYSHLFPQGIEGNPDELNGAALHQKAWELVAPHSLDAQAKAADRFRELLGTGRASHNIDVILPAAYDGRIETLFVDTRQHRWGLFYPEQRYVEEHGARQPDDLDLLDVAAQHSLLHGAAVYALPSDSMPGDAPIAAIFRY